MQGHGRTRTRTTGARTTQPAVSPPRRARSRMPANRDVIGWRASCYDEPTVQQAKVVTAPLSSNTGDPPAPVESYADILASYFTNRAEEALYKASLLSQRFIEDGLGPEEIIAVHAEAVDIATRGLSYRERARAATDALQFLLEMMIAYGVQYQTYLDMRLRERERESEARLALERQRVVDAEQSEREKEAILATISHELRTPITAATGNIDLALRSLSREQHAQLPRQLTAARDALGRLSRLTDDLIGASRDGLPSLTFATISADEILSKACAWARPNADEKGLTLVSEQLLACQVIADADALLTVFGNLLSNAIRYTVGGGRVEVSCGTDDSWVWFTFADTGVGMTPETRARIFDKFYRAPDATHVEPNGLGLGLSIAQRLVVAHGGQLDVNSTYGEGTTFVVRLPREQVPLQERSGEPS
jgi:signal transduction histidine kinase